MKVVQRYGLRLRRKRFRLRAMRKRRELLCVADRTDLIRAGDVLCFVTLRNERVRLKYFLDYYRDRGVAHFFVVDNDSTDGGREMLAAEPDCSGSAGAASASPRACGTWLPGVYGRMPLCRPPRR